MQALDWCSITFRTPSGLINPYRTSSSRQQATALFRCRHHTQKNTMLVQITTLAAHVHVSSDSSSTLWTPFVPYQSPFCTTHLTYNHQMPSRATHLNVTCPQLHSYACLESLIPHMYKPQVRLKHGNAEDADSHISATTTHYVPALKQCMRFQENTTSRLLQNASRVYNVACDASYQ